MEMNSPIGKQILALVRQGDYAHAGETEAIDLVFKKIPKDPSRLLLDVGCGRGGTAHYIQTNGWGKVTGIDIDAASIVYAKQTYPETEFLTADATTLFKTLKRSFDIIYLFNVLYALSDHPRVLGELRKVIRPSGQLIIFDYLTFTQNKDDFPFKEWNPLDLLRIRSHMKDTGWRIVKEEDVSGLYEKWYLDLVSRIKTNRESITTLAGKEWFDFTFAFYEKILNAIKGGLLGGAILYGEPLP